MIAKSWLTQLKVNGYRLTRVRITVVEAVSSTQSALNPLEVFENHLSWPGIGVGLSHT
jgi:Fe2+ or Zn2+ uptake regulation protein